MNKTILASAVAAMLTGVSYAQDYQFEVGLSYNIGDVEDADFDTTVLFADLYFDSVSTANGPLREASFLSKSSGVMIVHESTSFDDFSALDSDDTVVGVRYVMDNNYLIEASFLSGEDDDAISLGFGLYLNDHQDLVFHYSSADEADLTALTAETHIYSNSASMSYDVSVSYLDDGDADETGYLISGGLSFYFDKHTSLSGSLDIGSVGDVDTTGISINFEHFFTDTVAFQAGYSTDNVDTGALDSDTNTFTLGISGRF